MPLLNVGQSKKMRGYCPHSVFKFLPRIPLVGSPWECSAFQPMRAMSAIFVFAPLPAAWSTVGQSLQSPTGTQASWPGIRSQAPVANAGAEQPVSAATLIVYSSPRVWEGHQALPLVSFSAASLPLLLLIALLCC